MDPRPPDPSPTAPRATGDEPPTATRTQVTRGGPPGAGPVPPAPVRFGKFLVLGALGRGGMGAVYRAEDPQLGRAVALKVLLPELSADPRAKARFTREARSQAAVEHDHIVAIHEVGEADGVAYIAMPLLKGRTLSAALRAGARPPLGEALRIAREVAEGLAAAHAAGLIHRDIKPGNVWLEGPRRRVKILDFGLARVSDEMPDAAPAEPPSGSVPFALPAAAEPQLTAAGAVMGTPAYMSPEQARGAAVDARTDIFSLGVVLYQMATGERPFRGSTTFELLAAVASEEPLPPSALAPDVPPALDALVARLLAKNPADRPQTCAEVAEALDAIARGLAPLPVVVAAVAPAGAPTVWEDLDSTEAEVPPAAADVPPVKPVRATKPARPAARLGWKVWAGFTAAVLVSCGLLGAAAWFLSRKPDPRPAPEVVKEEPKPKPPPAPAAPDPHRELAKLVLAKKGVVSVEGAVGLITKEADLPRGKFKVLNVTMNPATTVPFTDEELDAFQGIDSLATLYVAGPNLTDDAVIKLLNQSFAPKLQVLSLSAPNLTDRGAAALARCPALTTLTINQAGRLTDDGLEFLAALPNLRLLQINFAKLVTGAGLKHLKGENLTEFSTHQGHLTDAAGPHLARCPQLTELQIMGTFGDELVVPLGKLTRLQRLNLTSAGVTNRGVEALADLPNLTSLTISKPALTDAGVGHIARMSRLTYLYIGGEVSDAGLEKLQGLKSLQTFQLQYAKGFSYDALRKFRAALPACKALSELDQKADRAAIEWVLARGGTATITGAVVVRNVKDLPATFELISLSLDRSAVPITATDLDALADCDRLRVLSLGPGTDDAVLKKLSALPFAAKLNQLVLFGTTVTDGGLAALSAMRGLRALALHSTGALTGAGFGALRDLPDLRAFRVTGAALTDAAVGHLRGLPLEEVFIDAPGLTDAALGDLAALPNLKALSLTRAPVTDAGLGALAGATRLTSLKLPAAKVTKEGVGRLFAALPECTIEWPGGKTPGAVPPIQWPATRQALEWVLKAGGTVTVEVNGARPAVKALDAIPAGARLAELVFAGTALKLPKTDKPADGLLEAIAEGLKDLPAAAWSERGATLAVGFGLGSSAGWDALVAVPGLRAVTHVHFTGAGAPGVCARLKHFPKLRSVTLTAADCNPGVLTQLGELPGLRELALAPTGPFDPAALKELAPARLERLELGVAPTDPGVAALAGLTTLRHLGFSAKAAPTAEQLKRLRAALPRCEILIDGKPFDGTPFERARPALEWVLKVGGTVTVEVDGGERPVTSLGTVPPTARLVALSFAATSPTMPAEFKGTWPEQVAVGLKDLPAAVWSDRRATLTVGYGTSTAAGWEALAAVPGLEPLTELRHSHGGAAAVAPRLARFPRLRAVSFLISDPGAAELRALAALPTLREVTLSQNKPIPAAALNELAKARLTKLTLDLSDTSDDTVAALCRCAALESLTLTTAKKGGLTDAQLLRLREALPKCAITIDGKPLPKTP